MSMTSKTMEFEHSTYRYDFKVKRLEVRIRHPSGDLSDPLTFDTTQIQELREALSGIGQQVPDGLVNLRKR